MKVALFQTKLAWEKPEIDRTFIEEYFLNEDESFDLFISDLYTENLSNHSTFFKLTNTKLGTKHFLIGIPLQTEYFKLGLGKEYDNFRSFPFNNEYRIDGIGSKEDSKTHTRLVPDFFGLEI